MSGDTDDTQFSISTFFTLISKLLNPEGDADKRPSSVLKYFPKNQKIAIDSHVNL